jgi:hypothetical protein
VGIIFAVLTEAFVRSAIETNGKIVDLFPAFNQEDRTTSYAPIFSFITTDGRTYTITSNTSSNPPEFSPGQNVAVLYDPRNPSHARLKSTVQLWLVSLICAPLGAFYAVLGFVLLYFDRRYSRKLAASAPVVPNPN